MTPNFKLDEFQCKCGCEMTPEVTLNIFKLALQLQVLRDEINAPITINSAYRCASHNKKIGGVPKSQHVLGKAADIKVKGVSPKKIAEKINKLIGSGYILQGGIGIYPSFTHYDIRGTLARWDYR